QVRKLRAIEGVSVRLKETWQAAGGASAALICLLVSAPVAADGPTPGDELLQRATALLSPPGQPSQGEGEFAGRRRATLVLNEIQSLRDVFDPKDIEPLTPFLARPADLKAQIETAHFRIHYSTTGADAPLGWPSCAFLDAAAEACERAWITYHHLQGWAVPPSDGEAGGDGRVDVYVRDLGWGIYGYALHEDSPGRGSKSGFIVVENDYAGFDRIEPLDALRTTLAHEYHHLIQFGFGYDPEAGWFMEQTATMEEGEVFPEIRDLDRYLQFHTAHAYRRLDLCNGSFEYGAWLWPRYLEERWGWALLMDTWETWGREGLMMKEALDDGLMRVGSSLEEAYLGWATWNLFLGERDDGAHYQRGSAYFPEVLAESSVDLYPLAALHPQPTRQPAALGASYVELRPQEGSADNHIEISLQACETLIGASLVVWDAPGQVREIRPITTPGGMALIQVVNWSSVERACLVLANGADAQQSCDYVISAETHYERSDIEPGIDLAAGLMLRSAPNPFEAHTIISFQLPEPAESKLQIFDAQGRLVRTLVNGPCSQGSHAVFWNGQDDLGQRALAGVFYGRLYSQLVRKQIRIVRIR
ncbi:MAG: hypothetical protein KAY24_12315, partial [Candidatus Eisenbacteria sp.]|nr:hypothetical protein [Candidatus Eisenbacteria bacterium]